MGKYIVALLILVSFTSCEKIFIDKDPANDPEHNFEVLWETLDKKYSFFPLKGIDWDSVYNVYRPQVTNDMNSVELFDLMAEMLFTLRDGHVNLVSGFDIARNWNWYLNSPPNFNFDNIERNYLGPDHRITGPFSNVLIDSIGYIYYGSFAAGFDSSQLDLLMEVYKDYKGLILDIRDNGGGAVFNAYNLAGRFTDEERLVYSEQFRNGVQHDDFTELFPRTIEPKGVYFDKPVVLLTNRSSYSAANEFAAIMRNFPQVTVMGDTTGGGGGLPLDYDLPNGWRFRFSSSQTITPDGINMELGLPPDIVVYMNASDEIQGIDTIIEEALKLLK